MQEKEIPLLELIGKEIGRSIKTMDSEQLGALIGRIADIYMEKSVSMIFMQNESTAAPEPKLKIPFGFNVQQIAGER